MARVLCIPSGLSGALYSTLELMRRLREAGHDVLCASPAECESVVTSAGFQYVQLPPNTYAEWVRRDVSTPWFQRIASAADRRSAALETLGVDHFPNVLDELRPDLVLIDRELHEHIITAMSLDLPVALTSTWFSIWRRPGVPPLHKNIIPGQARSGSRAGIQLYWHWLHLQKTRLAVREAIRHPGADRVSTLRKLGRDRGLKLGKLVEFYQWQIPFSYRSLPYVCLRSFEMEFPHEPRQGVHYVGPMINENRVDRATHTNSQSRLERVLSRRRSAHDRTLIYCGFGSFFKTLEPFLVRLFEAVASRPDWDLVVPVGKEQMERLADLPSADNIHCFEWVPQLQVMAAADIALVHGGVNTIAECVHFGVPMIVYNQGFLDMPGNTARVVYHGIGIEGDAHRDTPDRIRSRIAAVLESDTISSRVTAMRDRIRDSVRDERIEDVVDRLLASASRR